MSWASWKGRFATTAGAGGRTGGGGHLLRGTAPAQLRSAASALVELEVRIGLGLRGFEGGRLIEIEGVPGVKLVVDEDGGTYRAAYTVALGGAVYVLDVFQKKSKSGVRTPKHVKERVLARYKAAQEDHERRFRGGAA